MRLGPSFSWRLIGALPPSVLTIGREGKGEKHLLSWRSLAALPHVSPILCSSGACSSGLAVTHGAGERLGLERPLLSAGSVALIAPQWPVSMSQVQQLNVQIAEAYLSDATGRSLVVWECLVV